MSKIQEVLKVFDLFCTSQLVRFRGEPLYSTATGGFLSISIIVLCVVVFANMGVMTLRKEIIKSSTSFKIQEEPSPVSFKFTVQDKVMFAVGIFGLNLNDPNIKYFDFYMKHTIFGPYYGNVTSDIDVPLVPCNVDQFQYDEN